MKFSHLRYEPTPNYIEQVIRPTGIVIHWTSGSYEGSIEWLKNKESKASYHFIVSKEAEITQMLDTNLIAWHAGHGFTPFGNPNNHTIGISLEGPPSIIGLKKWQEPQILISAQLCKELTKYHDIKWITDHSTIDPERKIDVKKGTGIDLFPWDDFLTMTGIKELNM